MGFVFSAVTPMNWLAAALFGSAVLQLNGALAVYEDAIPGGFKNPDGTDTPAFTQRLSAAWYWMKALGLAGAFAALGLWLQFGVS